MGFIPPIRVGLRMPSGYEELTYHDVLAKDLAVMDAAAISLARENALPIIVFNIHAPGAFAQVMRGEGRFTRIVEKGEDRACRPI
jgi:uridylate kinase